ncbi:hypothetical protein B0H21DRAFT_750978 [Amylocystis lapponica]|nr:hypothetical protein B0H21DRAFT_750978 [Amylocystis lapponica]
MGKWTLEYCDDVLRNKVKNMVTGSVRRMKLEREKRQDEPVISYETFVEELDEGDSFTATLIDVLVKEMAERRLRSDSDRRLISERTAKSLRMQAAPLHVYSSPRTRSSRSGGRRGLALAGYLGSQAEQAQQSEEEDDGSVTSSGAPYEGFRINSELHDAYLPFPYDAGRHIHSADTAMATGSPEYLDARPFFTPSPPPLPPQRLPSVTRSSTWTVQTVQPSSSVPTSTRQNIIRRPIRSRTVDFNEFTHRRRSTIRQNGHSEEQEGVSSENSRDGMWRFRMRDTSPVLDEPSTSTLPPPGVQPVTRRFFPLSPWSQSHRRQEVGGAFPWNPEMRKPPSSAPSGGQSSSQLWYSLTAAAPTAPDSAAPSPPHITSTPDNHDESRPRLRRGGIRPPESLLSRYASPHSDEPHSVREAEQSYSPAGAQVTASAEGGTAVSHSEGISVHGVAVPEGDWYHRLHTGLQLPTPRSVSPAVDAHVNGF